MEMRGPQMDWVPNINGNQDYEIACNMFSSSIANRVYLHRTGLIEKLRVAGHPVWIDAGVDGFHTMTADKLEQYQKRKAEAAKKMVEWKTLSPEARQRAEKPKEFRENDWIEYMRERPLIYGLGDATLQQQPAKSRAKIGKVVSQLMDECMAAGASWISIPQLPLVDSASRNRINLELATAAANWHKRNNAKVALVLPVIFTSMRQIELGASRREKVKQVQKILEKLPATQVWISHVSIDDDSGKDANQEHLARMVKVHEELKKVAPEIKQLAGPYWLLNIVLWARGLVQHPIIGCGGSYKYMDPSSQPMGGSPKVRICLKPLARRDLAAPQLKQWLLEAASRIPPDHSAKLEFQTLHDSFDNIDDQLSRRLTVRAYREWLDQLLRFEPTGRAVALYQMLSAAHVLGATIGDNLPLPDTDQKSQASRKPSQVAMQLMLRCLS